MQFDSTVSQLIADFITVVLTTCVVAVPVFLYLLPAFIARNKRNAVAILVFNLVFGWTGLGWILALIWALMNDPNGLTHQTKHARLLAAFLAPALAILALTLGGGAARADGPDEYMVFSHCGPLVTQSVADGTIEVFPNELYCTSPLSATPADIVLTKDLGLHVRPASLCEPTDFKVWLCQIPPMN